VIPIKSICKFDLHRKRFRVEANGSGSANEQTIFHYRVDGAMLLGSYRGGPILMGQIIGKPLDDRSFALRFQCLTIHAELKSGLSRGVVSMRKDGRLGMAFEWAWMLPDGANFARSEHVEV